LVTRLLAHEDHTSPRRPFAKDRLSSQPVKRTRLATTRPTPNFPDRGLREIVREITGGGQFCPKFASRCAHIITRKPAELSRRRSRTGSDYIDRGPSGIPLFKLSETSLESPTGGLWSLRHVSIFLLACFVFSWCLL
jgi:hypothetical protein